MQAAASSKATDDMLKRYLYNSALLLHATRLRWAEALGCSAGPGSFSTMTQVADLQNTKTLVSDDLTSRVEDKALIKSAGLIAGEWREALGGTTLEVATLRPCRHRLAWPARFADVYSASPVTPLPFTPLQQLFVFIATLDER